MPDDELQFLPEVPPIISGFDLERPLDLHDVANQLAAVRARYSQGDPRNHYGWLEMVPFNLMIEGEGQEPFHSYFAPIGSQKHDDGRIIYFPDPREADVRAITLWTRRRDEATHPVLIARYADVLWDLSYPISGLRSDRINAEIAAKSYLLAVNGKLYPHPFERAASALRAVSIACALRNGPLIAEATEVLLKLNEQAVGEPRYLEVVSELLWNRQLGLDDGQKATLLKSLEGQLAILTDRSASTFDPFSAKDVADVLGRSYRRQGKDTEAARVFGQIGAAFEHVATMGTAMLAAAQLDVAIEAYRKAGNKDAVERVRVAKAGAVKDSVAEMTPHEFRQEVTRERADAFVASIVDDNLEMSFARLAARFLDRVTMLEGRVREEAAAAPVQAYITMQIMEDDHVAAIIGSVQDDLEGRVMQAAARSFDFDDLFLSLALDKIVEDHALNPLDIVAWANRLSAFPNPYLLRSGVEAWARGDWPKALHLLVFQIEGALRNILRQLEGAIVKPHPQGAGREILLSINELLASEKLAAAFGPDLVLYFRAAYCDPRGWNLRNIVAHAITHLGHLDRATCNLLIHSLLVLGCWKDIAASRRSLDAI